MSLLVALHIHFVLTWPADLSAPVDVYTDWIDACEAVAKETANGNARTPARSLGAPRRQSPTEKEDGYEDDGFVENDEVDGEAAYGDE